MPKEDIKYNKAIQELESIIEKIQSQQIDVDDLSKEVKKAIELIKLCKAKIEKTEMEVEEVVKSFKETKG